MIVDNEIGKYLWLKNTFLKEIFQFFIIIIQAINLTTKYENKIRIKTWYQYFKILYRNL